MPFISPWSYRGTTPAKKVTNVNNKPTTSADNDKYQQVENILNAPDYYHVLGVSKEASTEDIRRAYIRVIIIIIIIK